MIAMPQWAKLALATIDWALLGDLLVHFAGLSMMSVGGFISVVPEMQRYLVVEQGLISTRELAASIAIAQAAPGPNVQLVAVIGWQIAGPLGAAVCLLGAIGPSALIALGAHRLGIRHAQSTWVGTIRAGLAPLTVGLMGSACWVIGEAEFSHWPMLLVIPAAFWLSWRKRLSPVLIVLIAGGFGAFAGWQRWI
ncbi:MAG: chromate transporter [Betaproteobacteria bacterium]|nr:chromate transporter [Betaproteobacteria bacterium]